MTLTKPFSRTVWLASCLAVTTIPIVLTLVAKAEIFIGLQTTYFARYSTSCWYALGTLLGESITRDIEFKKSWAVRWVNKYPPFLAPEDWIA